MEKNLKQLLLKDLSARLPYGVKILYEWWDSDHGCEYTTIEELIGINDRFIYTLWRDERDKHSIQEPLSITNYKPFLRPMSSMTEEEWKEYQTLKMTDWVEGDINGVFINAGTITDWLNKYHFDFRGLIPKGLAIAVTEQNNPYN